MSQKITPALWYETNAEEAIAFYAGIFDDFTLISESRYGPGTPMPEGTLLSATFELAGLQFMAINGGPHDKFNDAVSFYVNCADQAEVDRYWDALTADGGAEVQCGWLKDKFGMSWQIVPVQLSEFLEQSEPEAAQRVMQAMLQMVKIDVEGLRAARDGVSV
ncbi:VOC family protein [Aldersonia sp. NBC_00410]|jgi:two-component system sensor histidine kinase QseC|uniref:VOC family protein n=1 Tax=Aldersonia sp. NBC_00410 TaxID=2975954 RepID=UPI00224DB6DE|nr:VOC family protein [Aldersonia sp. NBC_00410]MCX5042133.1 VOC family protein [Aldersonia sp. NBC_00410]